MIPVNSILQILPRKYFKGFKSSHVRGLLYGKSCLCESRPATVATIKSVELCHLCVPLPREPSGAINSNNYVWHTMGSAHTLNLDVSLWLNNSLSLTTSKEGIFNQMLRNRIPQFDNHAWKVHFGWGSILLDMSSQHIMLNANHALFLIETL